MEPYSLSLFDADPFVTVRVGDRDLLVAGAGPSSFPVRVLDACTGRWLADLTAGPARSGIWRPVTATAHYQGAPVVAVGYGDSPAMDGNVGYLVRRMDLREAGLGVVIGPDIPLSAEPTAMAGFEADGVDVLAIGDVTGRVALHPIGVGFDCHKAVRSVAAGRGPDGRVWVVAGDTADGLYGFSLDTGRVAWSVSAPGGATARIALQATPAGLVGVSCGYACVAVWDAATGQPLAEERYTEMGPHAALAGDEPTVYVGVGPFVWAYDAVSGADLSPSVVLPDTVDALAVLDSVVYAVVGSRIVRVDMTAERIVDAPEPLAVALDGRRFAFRPGATVGEAVTAFGLLPHRVGIWRVGAGAVDLGRLMLEDEESEPLVNPEISLASYADGDGIVRLVLRAE